MFKSLFYKDKKSEITPYTLTAVGYAPFTLKAMDDHIPALLDPTLPKHVLAELRLAPVTIHLNSQHQFSPIIPSLIEHECVHYDQDKVEDPKYKSKLLKYTPESYVAYRRLMELEAYVRQSYKLFHDIKTATISPEILEAFSKEPYLLTTLQNLTKSKPITSNEQLVSTTVKLIHQNYIPEEKDMLARSMCDLAQDSYFMRRITVIPIMSISNMNKISGHDKRLRKMAKFFNQEADFENDPNIIPKGSFNAQLNLMDTYSLINRDKTHYFQRTPKSDQQKLLTNLLYLDKDQKNLLEAKSTHLRPS